MAHSIRMQIPSKKTRVPQGSASHRLIRTGVELTVQAAAACTLAVTILAWIVVLFIASNLKTAQEWYTFGVFVALLLVPITTTLILLLLYAWSRWDHHFEVDTRKISDDV